MHMRVSQIEIVAEIYKCTLEYYNDKMLHTKIQNKIHTTL